MSETTETTEPWDGRQADGTFHPVYLMQIRLRWQEARDHLAWAASTGREAQKRWDDAVDRETHAHREMRRVLTEAGMWPPHQTVAV